MGSQGRKKAGGGGGGPGSDYGAWLTTVPQEQREHVAQLVRDNPVTDYRSFGALCQILLAEVLAGKLTPEVSKEARMWAEMMFTAQQAENSASGRQDSGSHQVILALTKTLHEHTLTPEFNAQPERVVIDAKEA